MEMSCAISSSDLSKFNDLERVGSVTWSNSAALDMFSSLAIARKYLKFLISIIDPFQTLTVI